MNKNSIFIPIMTIFLLTGVLSANGLASLVHAQNNNQTTAATVDQLASNLTHANSELPIKQQLKAEILIPLYYNDGTSVEQEKYKVLFNELVKQYPKITRQ
jgi:uncharacterized protein (DUF3084 family)